MIDYKSEYAERCQIHKCIYAPVAWNKYTTIQRKNLFNVSEFCACGPACSLISKTAQFGSCHQYVNDAIMWYVTDEVKKFWPTYEKSQISTGPLYKKIFTGWLWVLQRLPGDMAFPWNERNNRAKSCCGRIIEKAAISERNTRKIKAQIEEKGLQESRP